MFDLRSETIPSDFQSLLEKRGSRLAMTEADLNGSQRFAVDGFTTEDQCQQLMKLAKVSSTSTEVTPGIQRGASN